jgi:hypothetical protein
VREFGWAGHINVNNGESSSVLVLVESCVNILSAGGIDIVGVERIVSLVSREFLLDSIWL